MQRSTSQIDICPVPNRHLPCTQLRFFWYDYDMRNIFFVEEIPVTVEYRKVKNVNLYLKPPDGRVFVTAPRQAPAAGIREFVAGRLDWIRAHQERMKNAAARWEEEPELTKEQRDRLRERVAFFAAKWEPRMGVHASAWTLRKMKTRWGSCTVNTGRIRINTRLYFYPDESLEYIVVHELCHLLEPSHNRRFQELMTGFLPDWKDRRRRMRSE